MKSGEYVFYLDTLFKVMRSGKIRTTVESVDVGYRMTANTQHLVENSIPVPKEHVDMVRRGLAWFWRYTTQDGLLPTEWIETREVGREKARFIRMLLGQQELPNLAEEDIQILITALRAEWEKQGGKTGKIVRTPNATDIHIERVETILKSSEARQKIAAAVGCSRVYMEERYVIVLI